MEQAIRFLTALFGDAPGESSLIQIWLLHNRSSFYFSSVQSAAEFAHSQKSDTYVGMSLAPRNCGVHARCKAEESAGIGALWMDLDVLGPAHTKDRLPATVEEACSIIPADLPASMVIHSGHGLQAYWLFREPWLFEDDTERAEAIALSDQFQRFMSLRGQANGWKVDKTQDLARILRVPGTWNLKLPDSPVEARIYQESSVRYNPSDLIDYLGTIPALTMKFLGDPLEPAPETRGRPAIVSHDLTIDASATPEPTLMGSLLEDMTFRVVWERWRGIGDGSPSAYDLSIATHAYNWGCSDQQIVDLLIAFRRKHNLKEKLRLDYFRRTLSRAKTKGSGDQKPTRPVERISPPNPAATEPTAVPVTGADKVALTEEICLAIGQPGAITRFVELTGSESAYRIEFANGKTKNINSICPFRILRQFDLLISDATKLAVPRFKPAEWERLSNKIMQACIPIELGPDAYELHALRAVIEEYLDSTGVYSVSILARAVELGDRGYSYNPTLYIEQGQPTRIGIHLRHFLTYANRNSEEKFKQRDVAAKFQALGCTIWEFSLPGRGRPQTRYLLPESFDPAEFQREALGRVVGKAVEEETVEK